jgi:hypothetical protein
MSRKSEHIEQNRPIFAYYEQADGILMYKPINTGGNEL